MLRSRPAALFAAIAVLIAGVAAACNGGSDDDGATPAPTAQPTSESTALPPTPAVNIRTLDLEGTKPVQALLASTGGIYVQSEVLYGDITADGVEEAIVPVSSGGTRGDIAFVVLTPAGDGVDDLLTVTPADSAVSVAIVGGKLETYEPRYGPEDPFCCPAALQKTVYVWDGATLKIESQTTEPAGGQP